MNAIRHVGIVAKDIDYSKNFWTVQLGFECFWDYEEPSPFISQLLGFDAKGLRTVKLRSKCGSIIELLTFREGSIGRELSPRDRLTATGLSHIAITVEGIEEVVYRLSKAGFPSISEVLTPPSGDVKVVYVSGPDDVFLELVEPFPQ